MRNPTCAAARNDRDDGHPLRVIHEFIQILRQGRFGAFWLDGVLDRIERMP